ncbi:MAG: glycosyltransferase family 2 protein [Candidatus Cryptobacteroides sp.]
MKNWSDMDGKIKFSVIVPVYGVEKYIEKCARSLFGQTYPNIGFIFVNDGTEDSSIDVLKKLVETEYPRLKDRITIVDKENQGLPAARQTGLEYADGDYILHVDADDWVETDAVEKLAAKAEETGADVIYFDFYKEYGSRRKKDVEREYSAATRIDFISAMFNYRAYGYVWNKCTKRSLYLENPVVFAAKGMHEDIYLMTQLLWYAGSIVHLREALYHYRRDNPGSISSAKRRLRRHDSAVNMMDLFIRYRDELDSSPIRECYKEILFRTGWLSLRYGFGFFEEYPFLAGEIRKICPTFRIKTFILWQIVVKGYVTFRKQ